VALRQRIDAVESFAADVAHEIKNPLASLRSAIESLPRVKDAELSAQLTQIAEHDVRRIDRLVTEIAEASRIDAELSRAKFETIDVGRLVENISQAREDRGLNGNVRIDIAHESRAARVQGVPMRLERVFENLLDIAVSFSAPDGAIGGTIRMAGERARVTVCDEGPDIPECAREHVFARSHTSLPATQYGAHRCLGLAIAPTIAEAHDGL